MTDEEKQRLADLKHGAESNHPDGYVSILVRDFRWLVEQAEKAVSE